MAASRITSRTIAHGRNRVVDHGGGGAAGCDAASQPLSFSSAARGLAEDRGFEVRLIRWIVVA